MSFIARGVAPMAQCTVASMTDGMSPGARELRQGDPLSPYLFVIVMEYLVRSLKMACKNRDFRFHPKCKELGIVCLCFADDLMVMSKASAPSLWCIKRRLQHFEDISGLQANLGKSSVFFGGVGLDKKHVLADILGFQIGAGPFTYLGVPLTVKKIQIKHYKPLIEKITAHISSWTAQLLSFAGVLREIESLCRAFFWSGVALNRKKARVVWKDICQPKLCGGLGVKDVVYWNRAILCKLLWDIGRKKDRLWIRWISTYYLHRSSVWVVMDDKGSWAWRALMKVRNSMIMLPGLQQLGVMGKGSASAAYSMLHGEGSREDWWKLVWGVGLHPRTSLTLLAGL
ncbi:hypothetical protein Dimus_038809 [Dionaea muscipula]